MSTVTTNQSIIIPVGTDAANNPLAFTDMIGGVEGRLVQRYTSTADRTARNPTPATGELSFIAGTTWYERYTGSKWIPCTPIMINKTADQTQNNTTALANDTQLVLPLPTAATTYALEAFIRYSSSTTADIKYSFVGPAGAGGNWLPLGLATGATNPGDGVFSVASAVGSSLANGGNGVGTLLGTTLRGRISTAAAIGTLQLQWAQNALDATDTVVYAGSWMSLMAIA